MTEIVSLVHYLEDSAERQPNQIAVVGPSGASFTYLELDETANRVASFLKARGVKPGDRVGVMLPKSEITVAILFGIMKVRAAYVPADFSGPGDRCAAIYADCSVAALFLDSSRTDVLTAGAGVEPAVLVLVGDPSERVPENAVVFDDVRKAEPVRGRTGAARAEDLAYILYTSGSTGVPKGVMLTQRNAASFVEWCASVFHVNESDRFSSHAPFHFDLSVFDLYVPIRTGATLYIISESLGKEPRKLARFIGENELTVWYSTPSILALLSEFGGLEDVDCSALRIVLFAGEVFPVKKLRAIKQAWTAPEYYNLYGPTETNVCNFYKIPDQVPEDRTEPYPIGPVCGHCQALVINEDGEVARSGDEGLLYISGDPVCQGYWNRPELNATVFLERDGALWYNTGDVVREDPEHGFIYVGRRDRMVKRRGYRIELGEIESVLYRHPDIREAAVVSVPDAAAGVKILGHVATEGGKKLSVIRLKQFCAQNLLSYMNPDLFAFHEALPRTSTDKVDYQALLKLSA